MKRTWPYRTTILASCLTTIFVGYSQPSHAEDPLYFFPKNSWAVEALKTQSKSSSATCALSNQLNNEYIIQIVGTEKGFTNINLDVRQDGFKKGQSYKLIYSTPGHKDTIMPTKAFTPSLLVTDLRKATSFTQELSEADLLNITLEDAKLHVYMTGLRKAIHEYYECVKPISITEEKIERIPEKVPEQTKSTEESAQETASEANTKTAASKETAQIQTMHPRRAKVSPEEVARIVQQLNEKVAKIEEAQSLEAAKLKPTIITAKEGEAAEIIEKAQTQPDIKIDLPAEKIAPTKTADTLHVQSEEKATIEEKKTKGIQSPAIVYHVQKTAEPLKVDLTKPKEVNNVEETPELQPKILETKAVQAPIATSTIRDEDFSHMRDKIAELEKSVSLLRSKNELLDEELKNALQDAEKERMSVSTDNWNLERATMRFHEAERQIQRLGRQLQAQRAQCQMEKSELESMLFDPQLTQQQQLARLSGLEQKLEQAQADMYRQQRQYEERIRILQQQLEAQ